MPKDKRVMRVSLHVALQIDAAQELERIASEQGQSQTAVLEALIRRESEVRYVKWLQSRAAAGDPDAETYLRERGIVKSEPKSFGWNATIEELAGLVDPAPEEPTQCTRCGESLDPGGAIWLEMNAKTGTYHWPGTVPESQALPFDSACAMFLCAQEPDPEAEEQANIPAALAEVLCGDDLKGEAIERDQKRMERQAKKAARGARKAALGNSTAAFLGAAKARKSGVPAACQHSKPFNTNGHADDGCSLPGARTLAESVKGALPDKRPFNPNDIHEFPRAAMQHGSSPQTLARKQVTPIPKPLRKGVK